jgi:hypothetical protein
MKSLVALVINNTIRNHILTLPRSVKKRMIFEELARFISSSSGGDKYQEKIVAECYAQMRKYGCWVVSLIQNYEQFRHTGLRTIILGNSKMFFFMKQKDPHDLRDLAKNVNLSEIAQRTIQSFQNPENLVKEDRHSSFMYLHDASPAAFLGVVRNFCSREVDFIASTTGELVEKRSKEIKAERMKDKNQSIIKIIRKLAG